MMMEINIKTKYCSLVSILKTEIHDTITLSVVLCVYRAWFLVLHRGREFVNRVLGRIFGTGSKSIGWWEKLALRNFLICSLTEIVVKGKAVSLQAWTGPEGSRKLRFPDFMTTAQDGGKIVSLKHRPSLPPGNAPSTHFF